MAALCPLGVADMNCGSLPSTSSSCAAATARSRPRYRGRPVRLRCQSVVTPPPAASTTSLAHELRKDFPILNQRVNDQPLLYLDNAATSQKPVQVLQALDDYYRNYNSNVHRGVHALSAKATSAYEEARQKVAKFINAGSCREVVFTRNASEAINLIAQSWGTQNLKPGDEIILSVAEHHSNLVPWQMLAQRTGAVIRHVHLTADNSQLDLTHYKALLGPRTKLVSLVHVSNVLGAVLDTDYVVEEARRVGAAVLLDCCQSVPHMPLDVRALGADWVVASSHKMCGPTGVGFLWGRAELLESMPPWMGGGEMIQDVFLDHSTYAPPPARFEAGTPAIGETIGLGAACDYLSAVGMHRVQAYEHEIGGYLHERLSGVPKVKIYGPPPTMPRGRASLCTFNVEGLHATDVSTLLDAAGVAVRSGHHCTQPLHRYLGINASARASLYIYNTAAEVDGFVESLADTIKFFSDIS